MLVRYVIILEFCNHPYDYRPNRTPISPITIINNIYNNIWMAPEAEWALMTSTSQKWKISRADCSGWPGAPADVRRLHRVDRAAETFARQSAPSVFALGEAVPPSDLVARPSHLPLLLSPCFTSPLGRSSVTQCQGLFLTPLPPFPPPPPPPPPSLRIGAWEAVT